MPTSTTRAIGRAGMRNSRVRAMLAGLLAYPDVIIDYIEPLSGLSIEPPDWKALRDALLGAALSGQVLDVETIDPILQAAGMAGAADEVRRPNGLAFSFTRGNAEPERARKELCALIEAMTEEPQLNAAHAAASARLGAGDDAAFADQTRIGDRRQAARAKWAAIGRDED
jgi:DNA primase